MITDHDTNRELVNEGSHSISGVCGAAVISPLRIEEGDHQAGKPVCVVVVDCVRPHETIGGVSDDQVDICIVDKVIPFDHAIRAGEHGESVGPRLRASLALRAFWASVVGEPAVPDREIACFDGRARGTNRLVDLDLVDRKPLPAKNEVGAVGRVAIPIPVADTWSIRPSP